MQMPGRKIHLIGGGSGLASGCAVACVAVAGASWLWAPAFAVTWLGAYLVIRSRGCTAPGDETCRMAPEPLDESRRTSRIVWGTVIAALTVALGAIAYTRLAELWPLVTVAAWFSLSFVVAGMTGYPGCPETGAILSLFRRRSLATDCPPLEKERMG